MSDHARGTGRRQGDDALHRGPPPAHQSPFSTRGGTSSPAGIDHAQARSTMHSRPSRHGGDDGSAAWSEAWERDRQARMARSFAAYEAEGDFPDLPPIDSNPGTSEGGHADGDDAMDGVSSTLSPDPGTTWSSHGDSFGTERRYAWPDRPWRRAEELNVETELDGDVSIGVRMGESDEGAMNWNAGIPSHFEFDHLDPDDALVFGEPFPPVNMPRRHDRQSAASTGDATTSDPTRNTLSSSAATPGIIPRLIDLRDESPINPARPSAPTNLRPVSIIHTPFQGTYSTRVLDGRPHPDDITTATATTPVMPQGQNPGTDPIGFRNDRQEATSADPNERRWLDMLMQRSRMTRQGGAGGATSIEVGGRSADGAGLTEGLLGSNTATWGPTLESQPPVGPVRLEAGSEAAQRAFRVLREQPGTNVTPQPYPVTVRPPAEMEADLRAFRALYQGEQPAAGAVEEPRTADPPSSAREETESALRAPRSLRQQAQWQSLDHIIHANATANVLSGRESRPLNLGSAPAENPRPIVLSGEVGSAAQTIPTNAADGERAGVPIIIGQGDAGHVSVGLTAGWARVRAATREREEAALEPPGVGMVTSSSIDTVSPPVQIRSRNTAEDRTNNRGPFPTTTSLKRARPDAPVDKVDASEDLPGWRLLGYTGLATRPLRAEELPSYLRRARMPIQQIPTELNASDQAPRLLLEETGRGGRRGLTQVTFVGTGAGKDADAAAVRANAPIQPACGIWYMECDIISKGQEGYISIGLSRKWTNLSRLVGWEPGSYGWHMDDGFVFESRGDGTHRGWPTSTTGDTIGCGINFVKGEAFFTKNGKLVGHAFSNLGRDLYPAIGLRTPGEKVDCNFLGPFLYDIGSYVEDCQNTIAKEVAKAPIHVRAEVPRWGDVSSSRSGEIKPLSGLEQFKGYQASALKMLEDERKHVEQLLQIDHPAKEATAVDPSKLTLKRKVIDIDGALSGAVFDYLRHQGYASTATAFTDSVRARDRNRVIPRPGDSGSVSIRGWEQAVQPSNDQASRALAENAFNAKLDRIRSSYKAGRTKECWKILEEHYTQRLYQDSQIWAFRLRMQWFARLVVAQEEEVGSIVGDVFSDRERRNVTPGMKLANFDVDLVMRDFPYFICGLCDFDALPVTKTEWLVRLGQKMQESELDPTSSDGSKMRKAFACMAYENPEEWPEELREVADQSGWEAEAEQLVADIRVACGERDKSYIEEAITQTATTLFDLGIKRGFAAATFADRDGLVDLSLRC